MSRVRFAASALVVAGLAYAAFATLSQRTPADTVDGMRWIDGGEFVMGTDDPRSLPNERPAHRARVDGFWIDEHPVTNAAFRAFVDATGYVTTAERALDWEEMKKQLPPGSPPPDPSLMVPGSLVFVPPSSPVPLDDLSAWWQWVPGASWRHPEGGNSTLDGLDEHPVVHVSWDDAVAYANWIGKALPSEAEWEYAARGGLEGKRFSWGDEVRPGGRYMANTFQGDFPHRPVADDRFSRTSPVRSFPPNGYGLYDMAGNVWQWTSDAYGDARSAQRVIKGGSFLCHASYCESYRPSARRGTSPDTGSSHVGFRLVRRAPKQHAWNARPAGVVAAQALPDFSGRWTVVAPAAAAGAAMGSAPPTLSAQGDMGSGWGADLTIAQDADIFSVTYTYFHPREIQPPFVFKYRLDGGESRNVVNLGRGAQEQVSKASWRGTSLVIVTTHGFVNPHDGTRMTSETTQVLSLESPTSLLIETTRSAVLGGKPSATRTRYAKS